MKSRLSILFIAILITACGVLSIYSSTYQKEAESWQFIYQRQILWVFLGVLLFWVISSINYRNLWGVSYLFYFAIFIILLLVLALGSVRLGAQRWLRIGIFSFQPSEFAKIIMVMSIARYFTQSKMDTTWGAYKYGILRAFILPFFLVMIPAVIIIKQPDLGTGLLVIFVFLAVSFMAGVKIRYYAGLFLLSLLCAPILWQMLKDYQKNRILVFLNPNIDPLGAGYTVIQSKIAIGSGGFLGKGWLAGTQSQLHFLPEAHTDFIFATFSEEWGLVGVLVLLFLYSLILKKGIRIALSTSDYFGKLLAFGVTFMLGLQVLINIAMNIGLVPVVGVPLPLMSYGGSSILVTFISLGILANIEKTRTVF
ncbi:MAG: rod shape-determining protein RodA [Candidatus Omnitrophica bacterium]|jgi:rod shape determining protein RodA|nr:rod shape-determining protein RodA [Candidatus Omnitrophota bacterium]